MKKEKNKDIVIVTEGNVATVYSIKVDKEKLLDIISNISRIYGEKRHVYENESSFKNGVKTIFSPSGMKVKNNEREYDFYIYPKLAKALVIFLKNPSDIEQLDKVINEIKLSRPQQNNWPVFEEGIEYLPEIAKAITKKECGRCDVSSLPKLMNGISSSTDIHTREASVNILNNDFKHFLLLNYVKNSFANLFKGLSKKKVA